MEEVISGVCPKCGRALQIPAGLAQFSCLYCGARMTPAELLPEEAPPVSQTEALEAYAYADENLLSCVTGYLGAFRHLTKKEFPPYFQDYLEKNRPVFEAVAAAAQAPVGSGRPLADLAEGLLARLKAWSAKPRGLTSQSAMLDDAKFTVCLMLVPGIRSINHPAGEEFCRIFREKWLGKYPKKIFQLTTYEEIAQGFQGKRLCFITTAVCRQSGKPDDCPELNAFRAFRDGYLAGQPQGQALVETYYRLAPGIVTAIQLADCPETVYPAMERRWLKPCYEALGRGDNGACQKVYTDMVCTLAKKYLGRDVFESEKPARRDG